MSSSHLLRVLRPTCNYRQIYLSRTLPLYTGVFHRHFFSDTPIRSSQSPSETVKPRTRSKNGQAKSKRKSPLLTEEDEAAMKVDTPIHTSESPSETVKPRTRSKRSQAKSRRTSPLLTEEDEAAMNVSKLNLPPIDKWRQYFAIMEGQRLRFFLRNPDTARTLAEAFIPEGSKDLIVIEAAAGMHNCFFFPVKSW